MTAASSDAATSSATAVTASATRVADAAGSRTGSGLLYGLSAGHGVKHFAQGSFLILMPNIRAALGLSDIAVGGMFTARQVASGVANVPATFALNSGERCPETDEGWSGHARA